ncbi:MAG TPA: ABC transporter permease [Terriglobales bacterium]|jgi:predicted permease|nr:ABC transporter permease [Terriglobales bacterium]
MNGLPQDLRYALRQLRKSPGFATVAILTLALGIGANTAIFSLLDQALLRSLPVKDVDRLVIMKYEGSNTGRIDSRTDGKFYFSYPMYRDLRDRNSVFSGLLATDAAQVGVQWHNQPDLVAAELVSGNYFDVLSLQPALGRLFVASDDLVPDANPVVVLSFSYWQRRFGSDPGILNQSILVNGHLFSVVGVAPPGFHSVVMGDTPDVFVPMTMQAEVIPGRKDLDNRRSSWLNIVGKLKPGTSREQAEAGIGPLWYSIRSDELKEIKGPSEDFRDRFVARSHLFLLDGSRGFSPLRSGVRMPLLIVMGMVGLVALMACANVGSLLLVRASGRIREMSVRYALGAKRQRVLQQLLVEGLLLGAAGGLFGMLLAPRVSALLINMIWSGGTGDLPFSAKPDLRIMLFNCALALFTSLLFSLAPAAQFWRPDLAPALKQQGMTARSSPLRFRRISVALQVGLSLMLLVGGGLFVRTLHNLKSLNAGFATDHLLTFGVDPRMAGYEPARTLALYQRVFETLKALPGVRSVAATNDPELANDNESGNITIAGYVEKPQEDMQVEQPNVSVDYFSTLQMPLLAGRVFTDQDRAGSQKVAIVNESFARHFLADPQQALGHYFGNGGGTGVKTDIAIIGVVKDAKHASLREPVTPTVFFSYLQSPEPHAMTFYVRTWQQPESAESTIRRAMQTLDSNLVLDTFRTMDEQIDNNLTAERVIALLATGFGVLAALMAAVGLYGVLAYSTAQRTSEIGIRMALGATRASVVRMVMFEVLWLAGISIAVTLPLSLLLMRAVRSQLFGISSADPLTLCGMTLLVTLVALASAMLPARRAARVEPMSALRYE